MKHVRAWFLLIAVGMSGCESLPPKESASSPSPSLAVALGPVVGIAGIYGGVGWYEARSPVSALSGPMNFPAGALIVARDGLYFRAWLSDKGLYAKGGLVLPYSKIAGVFSDSLRLVVIEQVEGGSTESITYHYFLFPLASRNGSPHQAEKILLSLMDRSADKHLTTEDMRRNRDRVVAVVRGGNPVKVLVSRQGAYEVDVAGRAKKGAEIGGMPGLVTAQIGGGIAALQLGILGEALGAAIGGVVGAIEQLIAPPRSEYEQVVKTKKELEIQAQDMQMQTWLQDAILAKLEGRNASKLAKEPPLIFARVDDIVHVNPDQGAQIYLPLFKERIDSVLEVSMRSIWFTVADQKEKNASLQVSLDIEAGYRVFRIPSGRKLAEASFRCVTSNHALNEWQTESEKLLRTELQHCVNDIGERIVKDFGARFPDVPSLREAGK